MRAFVGVLRLFAKSESGATAIEYGLIVSLIFLAILSSVGTMSAVVNALYSLVAAMTG
jgi:Flp pilus assembly pilin Flp